ncbi:hypothetical protein B0H13DRAFT_1888516 [Mycena leptocephala]|nr:hypothetical protein B0H13DRAFT_1888516 [Mycena leptocephala]
MLFSLLFDLSSFVLSGAALVAERGKCDVNSPADPEIDVAGIIAAMKNATQSRIATYPTSSTQDHSVAVLYADWRSLPDVSVIHFTADIDIDCDGVDRQSFGDRKAGKF